MGRISALTEVTELASNDYLVVLDASANIAKKVSVANALGIPDFGWTASGESWSYASSTTITVPSDATTKYNEGMFVQFTQSTGGTKYAIIVKVETTTLTLGLLGGATLANEAITATYYSIAANPIGVNNPIPSVKVGSFSITASGSKQVTGVGFKPKAILFFAALDSTAASLFVGAASESDTEKSSWFVTRLSGASASDSNDSSGNCIAVYGMSSGGVASAQVIADLTSMDVDGFTLNVSTFSASNNINYLAIG